MFRATRQLPWPRGSVPRNAESEICVRVLTFFPNRAESGRDVNSLSEKGHLQLQIAYIHDIGLPVMITLLLTTL